MTLARIGQELSNISHSLDCEGSELKRCIVVAASKRIVQSTLTQLQATRDTLNTKMPWLIHRSPSEEGRNWTGLVKESRSLAE
ncbi:hypothetical protein chiPu_0026188, partial [Chiloscyllium punctatum]|nr:hypothetical protein [Chiloscyllium punctatum]